MRFREFWPLYLRAHRLPGTRALHYFATITGALSGVEAVAVREPLIFVAGIALSYAIAISAHWFVEGNQPLIRVNAFWGAIADLRMCWLAATRGLAAELARHGIVDPGSARREVRPSAAARPAGRRILPGVLPRHALVLASVAGLSAGLIDLYDLFEPQEELIYPAIQLGAPIMAFMAALAVAMKAMSAARLGAGALAPAGAAIMSMGPVAGRPARTIPSSADSLKRATITLLALGLTGFGAAELLEHGLSEPPYMFAVVAMLLTLLCIVGTLVRPFAGADGVGRSLPIAEAGPATQGLRVDGRAAWVDALENTLSFGRRRAIIAGTLEAGRPGAGSRLIDVGCGTGELAMTALLRGAEDAVGIDATPAMIDLARQHARTAGSRARFEVAVAEALPFADGSADIVTSSFFFHHLPSPVKHQALREMWRVLSPGGRLVITDYGRPRGLLGLVASFPMRFNFHEYVRPQLGGELERMIAAEGLGAPEVVRAFLGYITVLRLVKAPEAAS